MFDFEKLEVYQVTQAQNISLLKFLREQKDLDEDVKKLWKKASLDTVLNLAESTARMSAGEKKVLLTEARGAINECVAFLEMVKEAKGIDSQLAESFYSKYEQMSKMMLGMIRSFSEK
jgi:four helix bundle protein